jgi:serine/threonine protein kinase
MVFPYMDHDLAGLLENDRVKLQPSQIKLYMKQLLEGTEYMHRVCCTFSGLANYLTSPYPVPRITFYIAI